MKFLHTADLHLGRLLHERPLLEDQRIMLDGLFRILGSEPYAALVMAGDVYDRSIPAPEAVTLLGSFLAKIRAAFPDLAVLIIPGNHDSAERLGYGRELFGELGIHIGSSAEGAAAPVVLERGGERCAFFLLPFLAPGCLQVPSENGELPLRSQRDLAAEAARRLEEARREALRSGVRWTVLAAHLFAQGGAESESERTFLGTAERVDASLFGGFDYVALGHLHRRQKAAPNAWYSGSPLAYSFDEEGQEKGVLSVDLSAPGGAAVTSVPLLPARPLRRLSGNFDGFLEGPTVDAGGKDFREAYLELVLTDAHLVENPLALLRRRFPNLLSVRQDGAFATLAGTAAAAGGPATASEGERRGAAEDFEAFLTDLYGTAEGGKMELFRELAREAEDAAQ